MKVILSLFLSFVSVAAFAAPSQEKINSVGLEILIENADRLSSEEGKKLSAILAESFATSRETHNKVENTCAYDRGDSVFKCRLVILNTDDSGETESSTDIRYDLERAADGLPSSEMFYLTVQVTYAG